MISMHFIILFVIDIDDIRCLKPFLPLYGHFEVFVTELAVLSETLSMKEVLQISCCTPDEDISETLKTTDTRQKIISTFMMYVLLTICSLWGR